MSRENVEHEYPPDKWTTDGIAKTLQSSPATFPLPTYEDSEVWESFRTDDLTAAVIDTVLEEAGEERGKPVPSLPASLYLDFSRTGTRARYKEATNKRSSRLSLYVLAECIEREGEYEDDILDYAWAICEQTTWILPSHLSKNDHQNRSGLPGVVSDDERLVALRPARTAQHLAEIDYIMGDQLHPALRERIRHEVDRRVLTPYEERDDFKWLTPPTSNWNAVCNAGVGIAALHLLDDTDRQAHIITKVAESLKYYLAGFDSNGCTAEGISYWNYGFRHYVQLAAHLEERTRSEYSLLSPPIIKKIAQYPLKVEMSPGHFIPFSDATEDANVDPFTACRLGRHFNLPGVAARGRREFETSQPLGRVSDTVRALQEVRQVPSEWEIPNPPKHLYFSGDEWWMSRVDPDNPDGVVVAAKGGHNGEPHNHNDLGSFVLHSRQESLLTDLGSPVYDAGYFSESRYEYLVARSLGHNVPYVNGVEQSDGEEHAAVVLDQTHEDDIDSFSLQLAGAYPDEAQLLSLRRTLALDRTKERLEIEDDITFEAENNEFVEVLVSYFPMEVDKNKIVVSGESGQASVTVDPLPTTFDVERLEKAVRGNDVWRAKLRFPADAEHIVTLDVDPQMGSEDA